MTNQIEIIKNYLKIETNYAVIINGQYGIGKTHFYKNILVPEIKNISLPKDEKKKFNPIHISLFGLKSVEEIQTQIFLELFPIMKNKTIQITSNLAKSIFRGITQFLKLGDINQYINDVNPKGQTNYNELVICFDDLDRKNVSLQLSDIFGFINLLVENEGIKVLIIANETQLINDPSYSSDIKEKVIGISMQYQPNTETVYNQIIDDKYSSPDKVYHAFLKKTENSIVELIKINDNNFRNLIFFLEHFKIIFYELEKKFQEDKHFSTQKNEKLEAVLHFTLSICIEYKLGRLNSENFEILKDIEKNIYSSLKPFWSKDEIKMEVSEEESKKNAYKEDFRKKYVFRKKYYFFESILNYIIGVKMFDIDDFKQELEKYFIDENSLIPEHEKVFKNLHSKCLTFSNKEYRTSTRKMLAFLDEGKYGLVLYVRIFYFAVRFDNLLNFDLEVLKRRFKKSIKKIIKNSVYTPNLYFHAGFSKNMEFSAEANEILDMCINANESILKKENNTKIKDIFELFKSNFEEFFEKVTSYGSDYEHTPFWGNFNFNQAFNIIKKLNAEQIWRLGNYFSERYKNLSTDLLSEKNFITQLSQKVENITQKRKRKTLYNTSLKHLLKCLENSKNKFPN